MDMVAHAYRLANALPPAERLGLAAQLRRAAVSVPANIAEGQGRLHRGDFIRHLSIASGSLSEAETHARIGVRLGLLAEPEVKAFLRETSELGRMIAGLIRRLRSVHRPLSTVTPSEQH